MQLNTENFSLRSIDVTEIEAYRSVFPCLVDFERSLFGGRSALEASLPVMVAASYNLDADTKKRGSYLLLENVSEKYKVSGGMY